MKKLASSSTKRDNRAKIAQSKEKELPRELDGTFESLLDKNAVARIRKLTGYTLAQIRELELRLRDLQRELIESIEAKSATMHRHLNEESLIKGDDAEVAEKQRLNNATLQELDILRNRLSLVKRAIEKMKYGAYGICEETEEPISFDRLIAIPWARFGVQVQEVRERKQRDFRYARAARAEA